MARPTVTPRPARTGRWRERRMGDVNQGMNGPVCSPSGPPTTLQPHPVQAVTLTSPFPPSSRPILSRAFSRSPEGPCIGAHQPTPPLWLRLTSSPLVVLPGGPARESTPPRSYQNQLTHAPIPVPLSFFQLFISEMASIIGIGLRLPGDVDTPTELAGELRGHVERERRGSNGSWPPRRWLEREREEGAAATGRGRTPCPKVPNLANPHVPGAPPGALPRGPAPARLLENIARRR